MTDLTIRFSVRHPEENGEFEKWATDDTREFRQNILRCCEALVRKVPSLQQVELRFRPGGPAYIIHTRHRLLIDGGGPEARMVSFV
jgi:hypothetical protein